MRCRRAWDIAGWVTRLCLFGVVTDPCADYAVVYICAKESDI